MRPRNLTPFLFGATVTSRQPPQPEMTMIVRGTFTLRAGEAVTPLEGPAGGLLEQGPLTAEVFIEGDDERTGACLYPGDFADYKPRAEVFLVGRCHPPAGKPVAVCDVRFAVGSWSKSLRVSGKREWRPLGPSLPQPFEAMPLDWSHAFGGPGCDRNPCGVGFDGKELPNVEAPAAPIKSPSDRPEPAGFGPINPAWPQRAGTMGKKYDAASYAKRAPFYAEDFDWTHFLAAPRDQWLEEYLRGDEEIVLQHIHPGVPRFSTRLPGLRIRAFSIDRAKRVCEARMNLDTLFVDAEKGTLVLTWRGHVPCTEIDRSDMEAVLVASEKLADEPLPLGHYQPLLEAFHADPVGVLMDELMPGAREARAALEKAAASFPHGEAQSPAATALAVLGNADITTLGVPEAERPQALERAASAAQRIEQAVASEKDARAQAQAALPEGVELPAGEAPAKTPNELAEEAPDVRAQVTRAIQDGLREARAQEEKARLAGEQLPPAFAEQLADLEKLQTRIDDPEIQKKLAMASPPRATEIGPDRDLSSRNMTGRDFAGLDLSGANLEGAILSGACLVGTRLAGANLRSATLLGADLSGADLSHTDSHARDAQRRQRGVRGLSRREAGADAPQQGRAPGGAVRRSPLRHGAPLGRRPDGRTIHARADVQDDRRRHADGGCRLRGRRGSAVRLRPLQGAESILRARDPHEHDLHAERSARRSLRPRHRRRDELHERRPHGGRLPAVRPPRRALHGGERGRGGVLGRRSARRGADPRGARRRHLRAGQPLRRELRPGHAERHALRRREPLSGPVHGGERQGPGLRGRQHEGGGPSVMMTADELEARVRAGTSLEGEMLEGLDLSGRDLAGAKLVRTVLAHVSFAGANLAGSDFTGAILRACTLAGASLDGANLSGARASGLDASGATFREARLRDASLVQSRLERADFTNADLTGATLVQSSSAGIVLRKANLSGAHLDQALLPGADLTEATIHETTFARATLPGALFRGADVKKALFAGADLRQVDFAGATTETAVFTGADLRGAVLPKVLVGALFDEARIRVDDGPEGEAPAPRVDLGGANLSGASLGGVDLRGAILRGAKIEHGNLQGCDLRGADLSGATLVQCVLIGASLRGVNLAGLTLTGLLLKDADLTGANLSGAVLERVFLDGANLSRANLTHARFSQCSMRGARLDDAVLAKTVFRRSMLSEVNLSKLRLRGLSMTLCVFMRSSFVGMDLEGCDFSDSNFDSADLHDAKLRGCTLTRAKFPRANLDGVDAEGVQAKGAFFADASLRRARLAGARLRNSTFTKARMEQADLSRCDLRESAMANADAPRASLKGARLAYADLSHANLEDADLRGADLTKTTLHAVRDRGVLGGPFPAAEGTDDDRLEAEQWTHPE